jgi:ABC-type lipoprotein export system ATPase subunit
VVGLLGPNGAGKTTCFYSVMGLVKPDSGRILLDGQDITGLPMYRRAILGLGYLPQETSIFRGLTSSRTSWPCWKSPSPTAGGARERLEQLLGEFGLTGLRDSPAMALSGGERRRCEIARALAADPSIMLLDEPFAGIDPISISDIRDLVGAEAARHRRADHRPQCPRDARHRRPRLHHLRRPGAVRRARPKRWSPTRTSAGSTSAKASRCRARRPWDSARPRPPPIPVAGDDPAAEQAIKLLQLSNLELEAFIAEELAKNPLLESGAAATDGVVREDRRVRRRAARARTRAPTSWRGARTTAARLTDWREAAGETDSASEIGGGGDEGSTSTGWRPASVAVRASDGAAARRGGPAGAAEAIVHELEETGYLTCRSPTSREHRAPLKEVERGWRWCSRSTRRASARATWPNAWRCRPRRPTATIRRWRG